MTIFTSAQLTNQLAIPPVYDDAVNYYGKLRMLRWNYTQIALGTIGDSVRFVRLPPGKVSILTALSRLVNSAGGAGMTLNLGSEAYRDKLGNVVAANLTSIFNALSIAAAAANIPVLPALPNEGIIQFESMNGVIITGTTAVVAPPAALQINGYLVIAVE